MINAWNGWVRWTSVCVRSVWWVRVLSVIDEYGKCDGWDTVLMDTWWESDQCDGWVWWMSVMDENDVRYGCNRWGFACIHRIALTHCALPVQLHSSGAHSGVGGIVKTRLTVARNFDSANECSTATRNSYDKHHESGMILLNCVLEQEFWCVYWLRGISLKQKIN